MCVAVQHREIIYERGASLCANFDVETSLEKWLSWYHRQFPPWFTGVGDVVRASRRFSVWLDRGLSTTHNGKETSAIRAPLTTELYSSVYTKTLLANACYYTPKDRERSICKQIKRDDSFCKYVYGIQNNRCFNAWREYIDICYFLKQTHRQD